MIKPYTQSREEYFIDCPKCGSNHFSKDGIVRNRQRYLCKKCSFRYTVVRRAGTADQATKRQALQLYLEELGLRAIGRLLNYSNVAILKWIREFGKK
jgi:transposase-like protein